MDNFIISGVTGSFGTAPTVTDPAASSLTSSGATLGGTVSSDGGSAITERGVVYSLTAENADPSIGGTGVTKITATGTTGAFTAAVTGLQSNSGYTFKAYAINSAGTSYTVASTFNTLAPVTPGVSSPTSTSITNSSAVLGGTVDNDGGASISERGVVYALTSVNANPTLGGSGVSFVTATGTTGQFTVNVSGLAGSSGYTFRAYAANSAGTTYTNAATFTTSATVTAPVVNMPSATGISNSVATLGGVVVSDGGAAILERGFVYAPTTVNGDPLIGGMNVVKIVEGGTVTGAFSKEITGLTGTTGYSYRAYAVNNAGTSYSDLATFTTASPPTVANPTSSSVSNNSATLGGEIISDGGSSITEIGIVYSETATNANPALGGTGVVQLTGTGTSGIFTVNAGGLNPNTAYSFAAYAMNSSGTAYSAVGTFTTLAAPITTIPYSGGTYSNDFNWLPNTPSGTIPAPAPSTTTAVFFSDAPFSVTGNGNNSAQGWQLLLTSGTPRYNVSDGSLNTGSAYNYGASGDTDRALGSLASGTGAMSYGATLTNTGTTTYTEFTLTFTEEQWRRGDTGAELVDFQFAIGGDANIGSGLFTDPANKAGDLQTIAGATTGNGNATANQSLKTFTVTGISWAPGQNLSLKWRDIDHSGSDDGLGLDNLSFSAAAPVNAPGKFSVDASFGLIAENGGQSVLTVTRAAGTSGPVDVTYTVTGTAAAADYTSASPLTGTLSFADGETVRTIIITGADDGINEGDESLTVTLTAATNGGTIGTPSSAIVTILDDDLPQSSYYALAGGDFTQNWNNTDLITLNDDWSGVTGLHGFQTVSGTTGNDPQVMLSGSMLLDVNANQTNPLTFLTGGVTEFQLTDPTIALTGSNAAAAPNLVAYLNTTGKSAIQVSYRLRDLEADAGGDSATQPVSLQYRIGSTGDFIDVPEAFVADATEPGAGPDILKMVTLPAAADNQSKLEIRWIGINAAGNDEAVGIDDIVVSSGTGGTAGSLGFDPVVLSKSENAGVVSLTVKRTGGSTGAVSASYAVTGGTATGGGADYTLAAGMVEWLDGDTADKTIPLTILEDTINEADETIILTLSNPTGSATLANGANVATVTIADNDLLTADEFTVNGGALQRSRVTRLQLTFKGSPALTPANFALTNTITNTTFAGSIAVTTQILNGQTIATLTFSGSGTESGSLADGRYSLAVTGVPGLTGPASFAFHRLFGDSDANATIDSADLAAFGTVFGATLSDSPYDFNADNTVDAADFADFGGRFGRTI